MVFLLGFSYICLMPSPKYTFIIPVYNRPLEIKELLDSVSQLTGAIPFEIIIVEDGSSIPCEDIVEAYKDRLRISYFLKPNSGPGDSRNYGMSKASSDYFIILDSDVLLHRDYLVEVDAYLSENYLECFGGPDAADDSFTSLQKAIDYSMTSLLTTGGVRGNSNKKNYQPRSFNLGISREAYKKTGGFGKIHPGEDPDLVFRLWDSGFKTGFIPKAVVYHKRRISWTLFFRQVYKFGSVRPILNRWHPNYISLTFWFPSLFLLGFMSSFVLLVFGIPYLIFLYLFYLVLVLFHSLFRTKSTKVAIMSVFAILVQFCGYGYGFLKNTLILTLNPNISAEDLFPKLFFK